jgi:hypothetical protein
MRYKFMKISSKVFTHNITFNGYQIDLRNIRDSKNSIFKPFNHVRKCNLSTT